MEYLTKYQSNNICSFCDKFNKSCLGQMFEMNKKCINGYCPEFKDRQRTQETTEYHFKKFTEYTNKKN